MKYILPFLLLSIFAAPFFAFLFADALFALCVMFILMVSAFSVIQVLG